MRKKDEDDYDLSETIGYGKPPVSSRFKKGESGNPNGRPPKSLNRRKIAETVLNEKQRLNDQPAGGRVLFPVFELIVMVLKQMAASGHQQATKLYLEKTEKYGRQEPSEEPVGWIVIPERLTEEEWEAKYSPKDELPESDPWRS